MPSSVFLGPALRLWLGKVLPPWVRRLLLNGIGPDQKHRATCSVMVWVSEGTITPNSACGRQLPGTRHGDLFGQAQWQVQWTAV